MAFARGDVSVPIRHVDGRYFNVLLTNALYIPSYPQNIFSVQAATTKGASVIFEPDHAHLIYKDGTKFDIQKHGKLYYLDVCGYTSTSDSVNLAHDVMEWHNILGHCNFDDVLKLESVVDGMKVIDNKVKPAVCDVCVQGKMTEDRSRKPRVRSAVPLELVHTDLAGPVEPVSREGFRYAIVFTDDYSGAMFVYLLKNKSDTLEATERFLADSAPFGDVKSLRSDNGSEYTSREYESLLRKHRIRHETSAPYSPHQNGTAERCWRTLFEMGRCLLIQANLAKHFWPYAVLAAAYIRNRCYNSNCEQTPYFMLTGRRPNLSNMRVFGSECYAYKQDKSKLDPRCTKGIFLGYDKSSPAYLVYFPETGKVMKHRVVKFVMPAQSASGKQIHTDNLSHDDDDDDDFVQHTSNPDGNCDVGGPADDLHEPAEGSGPGAGGQRDVVVKSILGGKGIPQHISMITLLTVILRMMIRSCLVLTIAIKCLLYLKITKKPLSLQSLSIGGMPWRRK